MCLAELCLEVEKDEIMGLQEGPEALQGVCFAPSLDVQNDNGRIHSTSLGY